MTDFGRRWEKLRRLAGLDDVRVHDCRHTLASHAVMSGLDLYPVGRLLGNADTASTERYAVPPIYSIYRRNLGLFMTTGYPFRHV